MKIKDLVRLINESIEIFEKNYSFFDVNNYANSIISQLNVNDSDLNLLNACYQLINELREDKKRDELPKKSNTIKRIKIIPKPQKSGKSCIESYEDFLEFEWYSDVRELSNYKKISDIIKTKYSSNLDKILTRFSYSEYENIEFSQFNPLDGLINNIFIKKINNTLTDDLIIEYSEIFKDEIRLLPIENILIHSLNGIFIPVNEIRINENIVIILRDEKVIEPIESFSALRTNTEIPLISPLLIISKKFKNDLAMFEYENYILTSLRLFKLGTIDSRNRIQFTKTVIQNQSINIETFGHREFFIKYKFKKNEVSIFTEFVNTFLNIFEHYKEKESTRSIFLSLERFNWALNENVSIDRRILFAIMGLEPLYTLDDERSGQSYKLGIRIAQVLDIFGFNSLEVKELILEAYNFRNKVAHSGKYKGNWKSRMEKIFPIIVNYLRISLIIFLLNIKLGKDELATIIDCSLLNSDFKTKLREIIDKDKMRFHVSFSDS